MLLKYYGQPMYLLRKKNLEVKVLIEFFLLSHCQTIHVSFKPSNPVSMLSLSFLIFFHVIYASLVFVV